MAITDWTVVVARDDAPDDDFSRALLEARVGVAPLRLMRTKRLDVDVKGEFDVVAYASRAAVEPAGPAPITTRSNSDMKPC